MKSLIKKPSAWIPIVLSLAMIGFMIFSFVTAGPPHREADEGVGAHLFQLWLVIEVCMIAYFAMRWLPEKPREVLVILIIQIIGVILTCAPVFILKL